MRSCRTASLIIAAGSLAALLCCRTAQADEVTPTAKGIAGGVLVGGELVVFGEALFGVRSTPAYLIGAGAGAAAGGIGGYFLEQAVSDGQVPAYVLAAGLTLLIPSIVVGLDQTRFMPSEGAREDKPVVAEPGTPGAGSAIGPEPVKPVAPTLPAPGPQGSLMDVRDGAWSIGVPVPEVRPTLGLTERKRLGADANGTELRFPLVRLVF